MAGHWVDFTTEEGGTITQFVETIPLNANVYNFRSGVRVKIVGSGLILRNFESDNRYYDTTDEFIGQTGEVLGFGEVLGLTSWDKDGTLSKILRFAVLTEKKTDDSVPMFTLENLRFSNKSESNVTTYVILFSGIAVLFAIILWSFDVFAPPKKSLRQSEKLKQMR